ncbi:MAG: carboxypeptidase-like regulatory domain-containing protein, partial [Bacteroidota bacterium]
MEKIKLSVITFLLCLPSMLCFGQTVYEGQVINKVTELPLPGITVKLLKGGLGTQTNAQGYFRITIENAVTNDTLQFSSIGYNTFKQPVTTKPLQMIIMLNASNTALNEVRVTAEKSKPITLNKFNISDLRELETSIVEYHTMAITEAVASLCAKYFQTPQADMMLTTVKLGRRNLEWSSKSPYTQFLINI